LPRDFLPQIAQIISEKDVKELAKPAEGGIATGEN
jgi:hypothetical protein